MRKSPALSSYDGVEVILFDADGTLFDFQRAERQALKETMASFELACDDTVHPAVYARINRELWQQLEQGRMTGAQLKVERFRRFLDSLAVSIDADGFSREYLLRLSQGTFLIDGAEDLLATLRTRFTLAIVTNGLAEVQRPRLARSAIGSSFARVVVSEDVGVAKPDVRIFQHALRELRHDDPSTVLMVGDSLESDIRGGIGAGIRTCWFNPSRFANGTTIQPTFEIASLAELQGRLDNSRTPG